MTREEILVLYLRQFVHGPDSADARARAAQGTADAGTALVIGAVFFEFRATAARALGSPIHADESA